MRGSALIAASVIVNALGGFVFWLVAARLDAEVDFGRATALFSTVLFVNFATSLGLPVALARYAPDRSVTSQRLFNLGLLVTAASSALGSAIALLLLPPDVVEPLWYWGRPIGWLLFALISTGMSIAVLSEVRLMAMRLWGIVLLRVLVVSVIRLPLLWWRPISDDGLWLFLVVAGIPALSGLVTGALLARHEHRWALLPVPAQVRPATRYAAVNYVGLLALQAPQFALPLIVAVSVSATTMASFYVAFSIVSVFFLVPYTLGQVVLVEGGKDERDPMTQVVLGLVLAVGVMGVATLVVVAAPWLVTLLYGEDFSLAAELLPWFFVAAVPWAITSILLSRARLEERGWAVLAITGTLAVTTLVPAIVLIPRIGVDGAAVAWVAGNLAAAVVAVATSGGGVGGAIVRRLPIRRRARTV